MLTPAASATAPAMRPADTSPFLFGVRTVTPPGEPAARWLGNVMTPAGVVDVGPPRPLAGPPDYALDSVGLALEHRLHGAVVAVPHPARDAC